MNWADSSDDESEDGLHPARLANTSSIDQDLSYDDSASEQAGGEVEDDDADLELEKEVIPYPPPIDMNNLPENFPTEAPFTAHVKNVAFNIKTEEDLGNKIQGLVRFRYQGDKRVTVTGARFGIDRQTGKRRGYSYVEFGTAEELMLFLNINDGFSKINGRQISIDVARPPQNNRGGRDRRDSRREHGDGPKIDGSKFRGGIHRNSASSGTDVRERTSLKLQPRTKPVEEKSSDVNNWRSSREVPAGGRGSGRGRGGGGGGRQNNSSRGDKGGRGKRNNSVRNGKGNGQNNGENKAESANGWGKTVSKAPTTAPVKVVEEKKNVTKVSNSFAAFALDSDSD